MWVPRDTGSSNTGGAVRGFVGVRRVRSLVAQICNLVFALSTRRRVQLCATRCAALSKLREADVWHYSARIFPADRNPRIERVRFELRSTGVKPQAANPLRSGIHTRGYLPHVKREGARYFVTFRLADSLPKDILLKYRAERAERLQRFYLQQQVTKSPGSTPRSQETLDQIERDYFRKLEQYLDKGRGECWLRRTRIADLVAAALGFFSDARYRLDAWVIMPNHVHAVLWPMPNRTLSSIVQSWKRYTAREANKLLKRTGETFWQPEPFDHWIRNDEEHAWCCRYVVNNPVKAHLCSAPGDWKWSSARRSGPPAR